MRKRFAFSTEQAKGTQTTNTCTNSNRISLLAKPETLLLAYRTIRGNKGALTPGGDKTEAENNNMDAEQREIYYKSNILTASASAMYS